MGIVCAMEIVWGKDIVCNVEIVSNMDIVCDMKLVSDINLVFAPINIASKGLGDHKIN